MKSFLILLVIFSWNAFGAICLEWSEPFIVGTLDHKEIGEASGLAVSSLNPNKLYHNNDSGDGPYFYLSNLDGNSMQKVSIDGFNPYDVEALGYGKINDKPTLIIGDIGDNYEIRSNISLVIIEDQLNFDQSVVPSKILNATYPDRAHNAEGMALHPSGDLFIITKEGKKGVTTPMVPQIAKIFKVSKQILENNQTETEMIPWGELDLPNLLSMSNHPWGKIVTSFDISPDGKKFIILTYDQMIEFDYDLSRAPVNFAPNYVATFTESLPQQEAVLYLNDGMSVIYDSEYNKSIGVQNIYQSDCVSK